MSDTEASADSVDPLDLRGLWHTLSLAEGRGPGDLQEELNRLLAAPDDLPPDRFDRLNARIARRDRDCILLVSGQLWGYKLGRDSDGDGFNWEVTKIVHVGRPSAAARREAMDREALEELHMRITGGDSIVYACEQLDLGTCSDAFAARIRVFLDLAGSIVDEANAAGD